MDNNVYIPIIYGPTGSGKTAAAIELAGKFPIEIISADSRQIIRGLEIGTAKPTAQEQAAVPFHLMDIIEPGERYSAMRFIEDTDKAIDDIYERGKTPIVVGGTGLYLRALTEGFVLIENQDNEIRLRLEEELERVGKQAMWDRLNQLDPDEADRIHANNGVRVVRALEICALTGQTKTELAATGSYKKSKYCFNYFCLMPDREKLYARINERVDQMIAAGLQAELEALIENGRKQELLAANVIGYAELLDYIDGHTDLNEAIRLIKQNSRRYAKRQCTWLRQQIDGELFTDKPSLIDALGQHLKKNVVSH